MQIAVLVTKSCHRLLTLHVHPDNNKSRIPGLGGEVPRIPKHSYCVLWLRCLKSSLRRRCAEIIQIFEVDDLVSMPSSARQSDFLVAVGPKHREIPVLACNHREHVYLF